MVKLINSNESWFFRNTYLNFLDNHNILRLNFTEKRHFPLLQKLPPFYQDVITSFNKSKICPLPLNKGAATGYMGQQTPDRTQT